MSRHALTVCVLTVDILLSFFLYEYVEFLANKNIKLSTSSDLWLPRRQQHKKPDIFTIILTR